MTPPGSPDPVPDFSGTRQASLDAKPAEAQEAYRSCSSWEAQYRSRTIDRLLSSARREYFLPFRRVSHWLVDRPASECTRVCGLAIEADRRLRVDLDTTYSWPSTLSTFRQATETIVSGTLCGMSCSQSEGRLAGAGQSRCCRTISEKNP
jgi:hypothetical protein